MDDEVRTIDITPSWAAILPVLTGVLQNLKAPVTAHQQAERELRRMALIADRYVRAVRDGLITPDPGQGDTVAMEPMLGDPDAEERVQ